MAIPTWTPNMPASGQSLGSTRQNVNNNFGNYAAIMSVNHVGPNTTNPPIGSYGKHTFAEFISQAADPATATTEITLYGKTVSASTELFIRKDNSGAVYQVTNGVPAPGINGYTWLPGKMLIQWGVFEIVNGQTQTVPHGVNFPTPFPTNVFAINITPATMAIANNIPSYFNQDIAGFTGNRNQSSGNVFFTYIAIGN